MQDPDAVGHFNTYLLSVHEVPGREDVIEAVIPPFHHDGIFTFAINVFKEGQKTENQAFGTFKVTHPPAVTAVTKKASNGSSIFAPIAHVFSSFMNSLKLFIKAHIR